MFNPKVLPPHVSPRRHAASEKPGRDPHRYDVATVQSRGGVCSLPRAKPPLRGSEWLSTTSTSGVNSGTATDAAASEHPTGGLRRFTLADLAPFLGPVDAVEQSLIRAKVTEHAPTGFQVWGIPSGAERVLQGMDTGDCLLLLEADHFRYGGEVIHRVSAPCWDLSAHIWGEQRFPLIVLLQGQMVAYPWSEFVGHFGFDPKYHMRGNTMRLAPERVAASPSGSEEAFMATLLTNAEVHPPDQQTDFNAFTESLQA
jgi:hypothetical protein